MNIALRTFSVLALTSCLFPAAGFAGQLRQPLSVLPVASELILAREKAPQKRVIVAPQADVIPQWLLQASEHPVSKNASSTKLARKSVSRSGLHRVEVGDFDVLGDIEVSGPKSDGVRPTKKFRPQISPSTEPIKGPVLQIPGSRRAQALRSAKRLK